MKFFCLQVLGEVKSKLLVLLYLVVCIKDQHVELGRQPTDAWREVKNNPQRSKALNAVEYGQTVLDKFPKKFSYPFILRKIYIIGR